MQTPQHDTLTATQFRWETGFGYFLGSVLYFFVGSSSPPPPSHSQNHLLWYPPTKLDVPLSIVYFSLLSRLNPSSL